MIKYYLVLQLLLPTGEGFQVKTIYESQVACQLAVKETTLQVTKNVDEKTLRLSIKCIPVVEA